MTREQEQKCIRQVLAGDANAFEPLVSDCEKNAYNLALRMLGSREDAEDVVQEAFLKAYRSLSDFRLDSRFSVWLYRIVSNLCLDLLRSRQRKPTQSLTVEDDDGEIGELEISDEHFSPEKLLDRKLTRESVQRGLSALPDDGGPHIGIANARTRLAILCEGSLEVRSAPGEGTVCRIRIPHREDPQ